MKILVTGGAGYIGSHTVVALQEQGYEVVIADDLSNSSEDVVARIEMITSKRPEFFKVNLADMLECSSFFEHYHAFDGIIHFAAYKAVGESMQKPLEYYHNNINSLLNVLSAMVNYKIKNIVFSSSCTVYGQPDKLPVTENSPIKPAWSPYGNTKQIAENILQFTSQAHKLNVIALRYFNPIGAHASALIGELPNGVPNNLMPFITQTAIGKRECLSVFGNDYPTPDGTAIRDYIHVVDLADAHVKALKRMDKKECKAYEVFNVGTGNGFSVLEIIKAFERVNKMNLNYKIVGRREGDIEAVWADTTIANKGLEWKAKLSLDDMVKSAWEWEKKLWSH